MPWDKHATADEKEFLIGADGYGGDAIFTDLYGMPTPPGSDRCGAIDEHGNPCLAPAVCAVPMDVSSGVNDEHDDDAEELRLTRLSQFEVRVALCENCREGWEQWKCDADAERKKQGVQSPSTKH